jgi:hypothetical protein
MPMTGRAARDPKVRFELGQGDAPTEEAGQMEQLREEYQEAAGGMNQLGYNGDMLNIVPNKAEEAEIPSDKEDSISRTS